MSDTTGKKKMGRPSGLDTVNLQEVAELSRSGKTEPEIAAALGVSVSTLYNWRKKSPEFLAAINGWKEVADRVVEDSLYLKACGFSKTISRGYVNKDGDLVECKEEKYFPPDTAAIIFWLKNRKKLEWRDKHELEVSEKLDLAHEIRARRQGINRIQATDQEKN